MRFSPERLEWITQVEHAHFWHAPRRRLLMRLVEQHLTAACDGGVLDVGCGSGRFAQALRERGHRAYGVDPHASAATSNDGWIATGLAESLPFASDRFAMVTALDSLEHVDDVAALEEIARVLRTGGWLVASVPAHAWLWSERDIRAGHLRRYDRAGLQRSIRDAGFEITRTLGYQFFLLPLLATSRLWQRLFAQAAGALAEEDWPSRPVNAVLRTINDCEVSLARWLPMPTGSSLIVVARKKARKNVTTDARRDRH
ncbi:MAG: class I SAM-dependent methyltransferase [Panacagrimonas sp.]